MQRKIVGRIISACLSLFASPTEATEGEVVIGVVA